MKTAYDWITIIVFAWLVTRFLQQSADSTERDVSPWHYLVAVAGCAMVNWLGNRQSHAAAILLFAGTLTYIGYFIIRLRRPLDKH